MREWRPNICRMLKWAWFWLVIIARAWGFLLSVYIWNPSHAMPLRDISAAMIYDKCRGMDFYGEAELWACVWKVFVSKPNPYALGKGGRMDSEVTLCICPGIRFNMNFLLQVWSVIWFHIGNSLHCMELMLNPGAARILRLFSRRCRVMCVLRCPCGECDSLVSISRDDFRP